MTDGGRYANPDDYGLVQQIASMEKRLQRLETVGKAQNQTWTVINEADWNTPPENITSGTFGTIKRLYPATSRPGVELGIRYTTGAGTDLEFQILDSTNADISGQVLSAQNTTGLLVISGRTLTGNVLSGPIQLQARRANGAGTARFLVVYAIGGDYQPNGV